jgi:hypothetical protein
MTKAIFAEARKLLGESKGGRPDWWMTRSDWTSAGPDFVITRVIFGFAPEPQRKFAGGCPSKFCIFNEMNCWARVARTV